MMGAGMALRPARRGNWAFFPEFSGQILLLNAFYKRGKLVHYLIRTSSLGQALIAGSADALCAILIGDDADALRKDLQRRFPGEELRETDIDTAFERLTARVIALIEAPAARSDLPLDARGTVFQQRVWRALRDIPPGSTATYTDIAERLGMLKAVRAIAQACGANPLAVVIPCHRVVRRDGGISGYRWGVEIKRELLRRENVSGF